MFQNISGYETTQEVVEEIKENKFKEILRESFHIQNIILYIISFMLSTVHFGSVVAPFALSMVAATSSNLLPVGIIYIVTSVGVLISFGKTSLLIYILTTLIFISMVLIFRPKYIEEINEKRKLGRYIFLSTFLVQAVRINVWKPTGL